jgi:hypothetical protein
LLSLPQNTLRGFSVAVAILLLTCGILMLPRDKASLMMQGLRVSPAIGGRDERHISQRNS